MLWRASTRHLARHPWQIALSILAEIVAVRRRGQRSGGTTHGV